MSRTRFSPPDNVRHDVENYQGLMLAACMSIAGVKLLLGPGCTDEEARRFQDEARGRLGAIKQTIGRLKARM